MKLPLFDAIFARYIFFLCMSFQKTNEELTDPRDLSKQGIPVIMEDVIMEDRDLLQANALMIAGTLLFSPFKENLIESNLLSCIINKRIVIALPIAAGIAVLAYIFSFQVGAYAVFPAIVAIAILGYAVSKPAWLIVERVTTSDYGKTPLLAISNADREYYASLVEALRKAEELYMARSETKNLKSLSRIYRNEAYKILDFLRSQNLDRSSKRFYVEYDGRAYHAILQFQYERPRLVD